MSYSIVSFSNSIFNILEIISTPEIFNNFSSCEIFISQMVELIFFIFQIRNLWVGHKLSNDQMVERLGFRNFKINDITITKDIQFFYLRIYFFIS